MVLYKIKAIIRKLKFYNYASARTMKGFPRRFPKLQTPQIKIKIAQHTKNNKHKFICLITKKLLNLTAAGK
jgi:hypothetical protein